MPIQNNTKGLETNLSPEAYLIPHPVESLTQPIALTPSRTTIGRSPKNAILIDAKTVSRRHAVIISRDGNFYVNDMNSRNGTYINDKKINISPVAHHDRITFGNQSFLLLKTSNGTDQLIDASSTIVLNRDEIDPSGFLAYAAENARSELFPPEKKRLKNRTSNRSGRHIADFLFCID